MFVFFSLLFFFKGFLSVTERIENSPECKNLADGTFNDMMEH